MCTLHDLLATVPEENVEADHAVLVTDREDGNVARDVVFALNNLLRSLRDFGAVREREIAGYLLLEGDCGRGAGRRSFGIQTIGIYFDSSDAEQAL